ncbi:MAG: hypothetical protein GY863_14325 [bacterium]|nr:hypothetical protein [bacterium]
MVNTSGNTGSSSSEIAIKEIRELLLKGSVIEAFQVRKESEIDKEELEKTVIEVINSYRDMGEYRDAVNIAEQFKITGNNIENLLLTEFKRLHGERNYEEAAKWASDKKMSGVEVKRSATMAYEDYLKSGNTEGAFKMMDTFSLKKEELLAMTIEEFNNAFAHGHFLKAAMLGDRFNLSRERTISSSLRACMKSIDAGELDIAIKMIGDFKLINNEVFEAVSEVEANRFFTEIFEKFIRPSIEKGKFKAIVDFAENSNITEQKFEYIPQKEFLQKFYAISASAHNKLLDNLEEQPARYMKDSLGMLKKDFPRELFRQVVKSAEKYHNNLLEKGDLQKALSIKEEYGLFSKSATGESIDELHQQASKFVVKSITGGDLSAARTVIKEYNLPLNFSNLAIIAGITGLLDKDNHKKAFEVLDNFEISMADEESKVKITLNYRELMGQKKYLIALTYATKIRMNKSFVEEAAFRAWEEKFLGKRFDEALEIRRQHKIPKKQMIPVAAVYYKNYMETGEYRLASSIRRTYSVRISLGEWLVEFFMLMFSKN